MQLRAAAPNVTRFDSALFKTLQFYTPSDGTEDEMWVTFDSTIQRYHFQSLLAFLNKAIEIISSLMPKAWTLLDNMCLYSK